MKDANIEHLAMTIAEKVGVHLKEKDIGFSRRLPNTKIESRTSTIIVQFASTKRRTECLQQIKKF